MAGERTRGGGKGRELRLDWPDDASGRSASPGPRADHRLAWADEAGSGAPGAPQAEVPSSTDPAPSPRLRVRTRRSDEGAPADVHADCRAEIQRLRAEVEALEREVAALTEGESPA